MLVLLFRSVSCVLLGCLGFCVFYLVLGCLGVVFAACGCLLVVWFCCVVVWLGCFSACKRGCVVCVRGVASVLLCLVVVWVWLCVSGRWCGF